jgi:hypothetical protein
VIRPAGIGPNLLIDDAVAFALEAFDPGADAGRARIAAFDGRAGKDPVDEVSKADIDAMNRAMSTRASSDDLMDRAQRLTPHLTQISPEWSMDATPELEWDEARIIHRVAMAVDAMKARWPYVAVVTKLLYLKRPRLVPILDSYVIDQLGPVTDLSGALEQMRLNCRENAHVLRVIQERLAQEGLERSPVRIIETCMWAAHPRSPVALTAGAWERVVRPSR